MLAAMEVGIPKKGRASGGKIAHSADDDDGEDENGFVDRETCGVNERKAHRERRRA
jgi:hypothetical protein